MGFDTCDDEQGRFHSDERKDLTRLDEPKAFVLFFDMINSRIGLKPAGLSTRNAFPAGKMVRAFRLIQEFGIDLTATVRFQNVEIDEDGMMILNLRTASVSARAVGQKSRNRQRESNRN